MNKLDSHTVAHMVKSPNRVEWRGFTIIELMVTIAVVAILATLAAPSFTTFIVNQSVRTASYDLVADLSFARTEAIKRNGNVTIAHLGGNWASGWTVTSGAQVLRKHAAVASSVKNAGPASVEYGRDGRQTGTASVTFTFDDAGGSSQVPQRTIWLDPSGRPKSSL